MIGESRNPRMAVSGESIYAVYQEQAAGTVRRKVHGMLFDIDCLEFGINRPTVQSHQQQQAQLYSPILPNCLHLSSQRLPLTF